jgi:aquaporin NIP
VSDLGGSDLFRRMLAEAIGTFSLVTVGCGAIVVEANTAELTHLGVALAFALVVMVMVAVTGHISGAHLNPAVTTAFALTRHFPWTEVPWYVLAQIVGSVAAAFLLRLFFGATAAVDVTVPSLAPGPALGLEALMTAALMLVITAVATDTKAVGQLAAIMIGATVGLNALWGGPLTGASMNPARSFGPALASGIWESHWIYWVGSLLGAAVGAWIYEIIRDPEGPGLGEVGE